MVSLLLVEAKIGTDTLKSNLSVSIVQNQEREINADTCKC